MTVSVSSLNHSPDTLSKLGYITISTLPTISGEQIFIFVEDLNQVINWQDEKHIFNIIKHSLFAYKTN